MPKGGEVAVDAEVGAEGFEGEAGILGDGGTKFGLVAAVEGDTPVAGRPGFDLASGLVAADELADPFGTGGILAAEVGEGQAGPEVGEDPGPQVEGKCTHQRILPIRGTSIMTGTR